MAKIKTTEGGNKIFQCPGCHGYHVLPVKPSDASGWAFNGNHDKPTFTPSIKATGGNHVCHSFVTDGKIQFLADCTHELAGKTVDIPEWTHETGKFGGVTD